MYKNKPNFYWNWAIFITKLTKVVFILWVKRNIFPLLVSGEYNALFIEVFESLYLREEEEEGDTCTVKALFFLLFPISYQLSLVMLFPPIQVEMN